ncbi:hypothetical protein NUSPORA_02663 [Nucleospora cyclopteri]
MSTIKKTFLLIKEITNFINTQNENEENKKDSFNHILNRIETILDDLRGIDVKVEEMTQQKEDSEKLDEEAIYVREGTNLKAIIGQNIPKIELSEINKLEESCNCQFNETEKFQPITTINVISDINSLFSIDTKFTTVVLEVFSHNYRSFKNFSCWFGIYTLKGEVYLLDAIKFRDMLVKMRLLRCGVQKIIHCENCAKLLIEEFGSIGCFQNYNQEEKDVYIDFRIRPINDIFKEYMVESLKETVEKFNLNMALDKYQNEQVDLIEEFKLNNGIKQEIPYLNNLVNFREYLSEKYNEGAQYILPDDQLISLLEANPLTVSDFTATLERMSPILRIHATDILIILRKKHDFSLEKLKENQNKKIEENETFQVGEPHKRFDKIYKPREENSDFEISDVE